MWQISINPGHRAEARVLFPLGDLDIFYVPERPGTGSPLRQQGPNSYEDSSHPGLLLWASRSRVV